MFTPQDEYWMKQALALANTAADHGEVPVGAVLIHNDIMISAAHNQPISHCDPSAHAEVVALRAGAAKLQNYRLINTTLYVTLEPCLMCAGAMVHARISRLVYGAFDQRAGAISSVLKALDLPFLNHKVAHEGGLLAGPCGECMSKFFKQRRAG